MRVETGLMASPFQAGFTWPGLDEIAAAARKIEELGFDGLMTAEAGGHDAFLPLVIAAASTKRVSLGTGLVIAFPHSPMVIAQIAWDLQRFSGGRFRLGLGTQVKGHNERRYSTPWSAPPGPRLREYVLCLKAIFQTFQNGAQPTYFTGQHYQFTLMTPFFNPGPIEHPHVPIYIGAVGKYMARLAGELCDGICYHPFCTPKYFREVLRPAIEAGARKAGRQPSDIGIWGAPMVAAGRNKAEVEAARNGVKMNIAFYASTRTYFPVLEVHGLVDWGQRLHQLSIEGKWQEMMDLVSDEIFQEFALAGTYEEVVPRLKERWGGVFTSIVVGLPRETAEDEGQTRQMIQALRQP